MVNTRSLLLAGILLCSVLFFKGHAAPALEFPKSEASDEVVKLFFTAAKVGNTEVLQTFLTHGFPVNLQDQTGYTALMMATYYGQKDAVSLLLQQGANRCIRDKRGHTALMAAIVKAEWSIAKQLRQVDCDVDAEKTGQLTAEQFASQFGQQDRLKQIQSVLHTKPEKSTN